MDLSGDGSATSQARIYERHQISYNEEDDLLGAGGFGVVYRCKLPNSGDVAALKVLSTPHKLRKSDVADFIREAHILQRLTDCPYIIRFFGLCIDPGHYAIVMEYVEYGDLESMLLTGVDNHPVIKLLDCRVRMALQIAKGMNYLHTLRSPIIHRDLKTANVLVARDYSCKIIDFGLAKLREISTQTGSSTGGTVAFTAPEVFSGTVEKEKEMKIDVYSYAMVLWQLKEMKQLYVGLTPAIVRVNVLASKRPSLSNYDEFVEGYKDIIVRCWDTQPDSRLHFREIITMLYGITSQIPSVTPASAPTGSSSSVPVTRPAVSANRDVSTSSSDVPITRPTATLPTVTHPTVTHPTVTRSTVGARLPTSLNRYAATSSSNIPSTSTSPAAVADSRRYHLELAAKSRCSDEEIVTVSDKISAVWTRLVPFLLPSLFSTNKIEMIEREYQGGFLQARAALEMWSNALSDKAMRRVLIKALCNRGYRSQASDTFGEELVTYVLSV